MERGAAVGQGGARGAKTGVWADTYPDTQMGAPGWVLVLTPPPPKQKGLWTFHGVTSEGRLLIGSCGSKGG